jgi:hypothetical protein
MHQKQPPAKVAIACWDPAVVEGCFIALSPDLAAEIAKNDNAIAVNVTCLMDILLLDCTTLYAFANASADEFMQ